jgi:hypothetical protein
MRRPSSLIQIVIACAFLPMMGCGGGDDQTTGPNGPEETGLLVSNNSTYPLSNIFVRTCGTQPWSTDLSDTTDRAPNDTINLQLAPGCYDVMAVSGSPAKGIQHRHAPGVQVTAGEATRLALATSEFETPHSREGCLADSSDVLGAVYVVDKFVIMDQMLDPQADAYMREEFAYQTAFFNLAEPTYFLGLMDSENPNAVASPTGFIAFGDYLYSLHGAEHGAAGVQSSLAHEYGHRVQHTQGHFGEDPDYLAAGPGVLILELEADAFAGYYMAHPAGKNASAADIEAMYQHFYSFGTDDFAFYEPGWHGTRYQRYASNYIGAQTAYLAAQYGYAYTYQELHDAWLNTIITDIIQNPVPAVRGRPPLALTAKAQELYSRLPHQRIRELARGNPAW